MALLAPALQSKLPKPVIALGYQLARP